VDALGVITQPYPGNNWRFVASTRQAWLGGVYIDTSDGMTLKDSEGENVPEWKCTQPLTCWRYLHVEVDSMGWPEDNQPFEGAHIFGSVEGESDELSDTVLLDAEAEFTPGGQLVGSIVDPDIDDQDTEPYVVTEGRECSVICDGATMLDHADTGDTYAIDTHDVNPGDVDRPDTGLMKIAFAPARISVKEDTGRNTPNVPFIRAGIDTSYRATLPEHDKYWCVYIMGAYERRVDRDNDPDTETGWSGSTFVTESEWSFIYKETIRDLCEDGEHPTWSGNQTPLERRTVNHECGHHFELIDQYVDPSCVMYGIASPTKAPGFCAACIKKGSSPESVPPIDRCRKG